MNLQKYDETFDSKALDKKEVHYESHKNFVRMEGLAKNEKNIFDSGVKQKKEFRLYQFVVDNRFQLSKWYCL